jgi:hypothetical protein
MLRVNPAQIEAEMRKLEAETLKLAEQRVTDIAGDAPTLTRTQLARIWNKSPPWVKAMQAAGRVPTIPFGKREHSPRAVAIMGLVKGV